MHQFIGRRLVFLVPAWLALSVVVFGMIYAIPGDAVSVMLGTNPPPGAEERLRERLGLDQPVHVQYWRWLSSAVRGDLGESHFLGQSVVAAIASRLEVTLNLSILALAFTVVIGVPLGLWAAMRANTWVDTTVMAISLAGLSVPHFALGLLLIYVFSLGLGWFTTGGYSSLASGVGPWLRSLALPAFTLGLGQAALVARITRSSMLEVLGLDFIRTARAKGVSEQRVHFGHALSNAIIPVITVIGTTTASLLAGTFVVETVFNLPGIGRLVVLAIMRRDYALVQGGVLFIATVVVLMNLAVDVLYGVCDPRIRYS